MSSSEASLIVYAVHLQYFANIVGRAGRMFATDMALLGAWARYVCFGFQFESQSHSQQPSAYVCLVFP